MKQTIIITAISILTVASGFAEGENKETTTGEKFNLTAEINRVKDDQTYGVISKEEAIHLIHDAEMRAEMERNQSNVDADRRATRAYYSQFSEAQAVSSSHGATEQKAEQKH